jgi:hypothetical protein
MLYCLILREKEKIYLNFSRFFFIINEESASVYKESSADRTVMYFPPVA